MSQDDFDALLTGARSGSESAWARLYAQLSGPLLGYLRMRGAHDPEDLLGEVFLQAVRDLEEFEGDEQGFRAWMFTIAHRRLLDEHRRRTRRPVEVPDDDLPPHAGPTTDDEAAAIANLTTGEVLALLDHLTDDQRDALVLRVVDGLRVSEVAAVLGRSTEATKALQRRGLRALRRHLADR